jgi:hypothetical protein
MSRTSLVADAIRVDPSDTSCSLAPSIDRYVIVSRISEWSRYTDMNSWVSVYSTP